MGRATVKALTACGARVFALDRTVGEADENVIPIEADITTEEGVLKALEEVRGYTDSLSAIVHFAGVYMLDSLVELGTEEYDRIFDVNVRGAFLVNKIFLPHLRPGSKILITTSELAPLDPLPFTGIYAVTKAALDKYAYSLRMELQLLGISVTVLRAGAVSTDMLGASTAALDRFTSETRIYSCNAKRFKGIVESVEARSVLPSVIAKRALKIIGKKNPRFAYSVNRNPLLLLLNALPKRLQLFIIRKILK
jgi:NAD(P)-dependent dehydrogenase (short-subunit alcohol dehydrogenase family)